MSGLEKVLLEVEQPTMRAAKPVDKRVPFGWTMEAVEPAVTGNATLLKLSPDNRPALRSLDGDCRVYLRLTVAIDIREEKRLQVSLPGSGKAIGEFDIRFGYALQPFELSIASDDAPDVLAQGVRLRLTSGEQPFWFLTDAGSVPGCETLLPHLLIAERGKGGAGELLSRLASAASLQPFGWMEGCVLDALYDLNQVSPKNSAYREALRLHVDHFLPAEGGLVYENPRSEPVDGTVYGIEGSLPFAVIAKLQPEHPVIELALTFWRSRASEPNKVIADGTHITTEGAYTVAYPISVLARLRGDKELADLAISNLISRRDMLRTDQGLCWIYPQDKDGNRYLNWARAYAWYMMGQIRVIGELHQMEETKVDPVKLETLESEFRSVAEIALNYQHTDGLWFCMLHEPETGFDTSGSAGIAAAIALGVKLGVLPDVMLGAACRTYLGLLPHLTPDGLLGGVAQSNRDGEKLQRSGYRVLSQMAMGLMGQLAAAIGRL